MRVCAYEIRHGAGAVVGDGGDFAAADDCEMGRRGAASKEGRRELCTQRSYVVFAVLELSLLACRIAGSGCARFWTYTAEEVADEDYELLTALALVERAELDLFSILVFDLEVAGFFQCFDRG